MHIPIYRICFVGGFSLILGLFVTVPLAASAQEVGSTTPEAAPAQIQSTSTVASFTLIPDGTHIRDHQIWTKAGNPYVIDGDISIEGDTGALTIEPGVIVKMKKDASIQIDAGTLAVGNDRSSESVVFTSIADDSAGGDTNADGDASDPDDNRWSRIILTNNSSVLDVGQADFRYAGGDATYALCGHRSQSEYVAVCDNALSHEGAIHADGGSADIHDSTFEWSGESEVFIGDAQVTLERDLFEPSPRTINIWPSSNLKSVQTVTVHDSSLANGSVYLIHKHAVLNFENNWWGSPDGPPDNWFGHGWDPNEDVDAITHTEPWLTSDPFGSTAPDEPSICRDTCISSVLFLPGIEGSRLYDEDGKLWEPGLLNGNENVQSLSLDENGKSVRSNIVAKEGDVIDSTYGADVYRSFFEQLDALTESDIMDDWKVDAYDWRLSLDDILSKGSVSNGTLSYTNATDTPYIEQTLRELAAHSKTGKVTIVAHSNGGLVAKALMETMGAEETSKLIDKVVFVGAPQSGAPEALGALLYGYNSGIPKNLPLVVTPDTVRTFLQNAPMAYQLLPSQAYFADANDSAHSVATFTGEHVYQQEEDAYGDAIDNEQELDDFLLAHDGGRQSPAPADLTKAAIANPTLIDEASIEHIRIDAWMPPPGVGVYQIAGWGVDTVSGIDFYEQRTLLGLLGYADLYRPKLTNDGDGTVPSLSALMIPSGGSVKSYWLDLDAVRKTQKKSYSHATLFADPDLRDFLEQILIGEVPTAPFISQIKPSQGDADKELRFFIHSPVSLDAYNAAGEHTGAGDDGGIEENIPGSHYEAFGEVRYISVPNDGSQYTLRIVGEDTGTFSLDLQEVEGDTVLRTSTISDIPVEAGSIATMDIRDGISATSTLTLDAHADGQSALLPFTPGETVSYQAPITIPPETDSGSGSNSNTDSGTGHETVSDSSGGHHASQTPPSEEVDEPDGSSTPTTSESLLTQVAAPESIAPLISTPAVEQQDVQTEQDAVEQTAQPILEQEPSAEPDLPLTASAFDSASQLSWIEALERKIWNLFQAICHMITKIL